MSPDSCPCLRWPLETKTVSQQGEPFVVLVDKIGLSKEPVVFPAGAAPILALFDGTHSIREIATRYERWGVTVDAVLDLALQLEQFFLLDNDEARERLKQMRQDYSKLDVREAVLPGLVYPEDPAVLKKLLDGYLEDVALSYDVNSLPDEVLAVICPHIDYNRGWHTYAALYSALPKIEPPDVMFLFGTSHYPGRGFFHVSKKDFEVPGGSLRCAKRSVDKLAKLYGKSRSFEDELLHKEEHSLELQLPFLHNCYGDRAPEIVPVLVGSFGEMVNADKNPREVPEVADFISALSEVVRGLRKKGKRVCLYGGIDLAHVGLFFGDNSAQAGNVEELKERDMSFLDHALAADEGKLFEHIASDEDTRRVCGFPSLFTMIASLNDCGIDLDGKVLEYRQAVDEDADCIVSFASALWAEKVGGNS